MIDRRTFIRAAGASFVASLASQAQAALDRTDALYAAACRTPEGAYAVATFTERGEIVHVMELPARGHDVTVDPQTGRAVAFARRPGTFAVIFDPRGGASPQTVTCPAGRHFYGHGVFSPDGRLLYATANDFETTAGVIGIYDATDGFVRVGEISTHGVGPHELLLLPDGRRLAIANGGIETHPDFGRTKLNIDTMRPSLAIVDRLTGDLVEQHQLPPELHQLSIRHMAIDGEGVVWFGCQHQDKSQPLQSMIGRLRPDRSFALVDVPGAVVAATRNHVGSVARNLAGDRIAVSSPVGDAALVFDAATAELLTTVTEPDVCGLAAAATGLIATSGRGVTRPVEKQAPRFASTLRFDNHAIRLGG